MIMAYILSGFHGLKYSSKNDKIIGSIANTCCIVKATLHNMRWPLAKWYEAGSPSSAEDCDKTQISGCRSLRWAYQIQCNKLACNNAERVLDFNDMWICIYKSALLELWLCLCDHSRVWAFNWLANDRIGPPTRQFFSHWHVFQGIAVNPLLEENTDKDY